MTGNVERASELIQICYHEPDISQAQAALAQLEVAPLSLPTLIQQLNRQPEFAALAGSLNNYHSEISESQAWLRVLVALRANRPRLLAVAGAEVVQPLLDIYAGKAKKIFRVAREALSGLASPEAQQFLCQQALKPFSRELVDIVVEAGFVPQSSYDRALFFFMTEQWKKYESLDFDSSLMRWVYETADNNLQQQIAQLGRLAGRPEIIKIMSGRSSRSFSAEEWQLAINVLVENGRWNEAWELVHTAPPQFSLQLLKALVKNNWQPTGLGPQIGFKDLVKRLNRLKTPIFSFGATVEQVSEQLLIYNEHAGTVVKQILSADDKTLAVLYDSGAIDVWNIGEMTILHSLSRYDIARWRGEEAGLNYEEYEYTLYDIALSPDGANLVLVDYKSRYETILSFRVRLFLLATGWASLLTELKSNSVGTYYDYVNSYFEDDYDYYSPPLVLHSALTFSPTGKYLAAVLSHQAFIWDIETLSGQLKQNSMILGYDETFRPAFLPDDVHLLLAKSLYRPVTLPTEKTKTAQNTLRFEDWVFVSDAKVTLTAESLTAFSGNNRSYLVVASNLAEGNQKIELLEFDGRRLSLLQTLNDSSGRIYSVAISPDKTRLALGYENFIVIWSLPDFSFVNLFEAHIGQISQLFFSEGGSILNSLGLDGCYKQWRSPLSELASRPLEATTIRDLLAVRQALLTVEIEADKRWLAFLDGLLSRRYQHDIEVGEIAPPTEADEFDIELE